MEVLTAVIDLIFGLALFINALLFIPQALKIFREKTSKAISLLTFSGFLLIQLAAVLYGVIHQDKIMAIGYFLSIITCGTVVLLTLFYKRLPSNNNLNSRDCTNEMEQKLETLENILAIMPGHVYWVNKENVYQGCNDNQAKSSGLNSRHEIIGKRNCELPWNIDSGTLPNDLDAINASVMESGKTMVLEEPATLADGFIVTYLSNKVPLYNRDDQIIGMVGISVDITKLKETEMELTKQKDKAEESAKAKSEFLANMRHDIRTPLSGIIGFSEILKSESSEPRIKEYADNLIASSHALLHLMDEVLEAVRVSSGDIPMLKRKFNLTDTFEQIVALNRAKASEKRLDLSLSMDSNLPQFVIGDKIRLHRIALELVGNALNFTDSGHVAICVSLAKKEHCQLVVKLTVSDSGIGIAKDKQQDIYVQFKRLTPSYQGIYKGAGLGLYVVKQFIDELEGEIYVESEPHKGTLFTCLIPLQEPLLDDASGMDMAKDLENEKPYITPATHQLQTTNPMSKA